MNRILRGLFENRAATDPASEDVLLRGRTYTIPFETVWQASLGLGGGGLVGWTVGRADDQRGVIEALAKTPFIGSEADVVIRVGLDRLAQTRVDLVAVSRKERGDWGRTRRLIGRFLRKLDRRLEVRPEQVIDPTRHPEYSGL